MSKANLAPIAVEILRRGLAQKIEADIGKKLLKNIRYN
jgi:hypothetical protein